MELRGIVGPARNSPYQPSRGGERPGMSFRKQKERAQSSPVVVLKGRDEISKNAVINGAMTKIFFGRKERIIKVSAF